MKSVLQFDLAYSKSVAHVRIEAHPAYLRTINDHTLASGLFFSEEELTENKKISDFLFHQLQISYADMDQKKSDQQKQEKEPEVSIHQTVLQNQGLTNDPAQENFIPDELEELILQVESPKAQLEPVKDILYRVLAGMKVIQEITRHIDERISLIEHKLSRKN